MRSAVVIIVAVCLAAHSTLGCCAHHRHDALSIGCNHSSHARHVAGSHCHHERHFDDSHHTDAASDSVAGDLVSAPAGHRCDEGHCSAISSNSHRQFETRPLPSLLDSPSERASLGRGHFGAAAVNEAPLTHFLLAPQLRCNVLLI